MNDRKLDNLINSYYKDYEEDGRLDRDKFHYLEFITTTNYIDRYLKDGDKILEVGAGTGRYSLHYAKLGYSVDSLELVQDNIEVFKNNIEEGMNIRVEQGNALNLSGYEDNSFDVTLVLGPLYHLFKKEEQEAAIREAVRVTKKGGIIYLAFVLFDLSMLDSCFVKGTISKDYIDNKRLNKDYTPVNVEENIFNLMYFDDVKKLIDGIEVEKIHYVATDGVGRIIKDTVNNMDEEMYQHYVNYHLSICEREDLIGYSGHILGIVKK